MKKASHLRLALPHESQHRTDLKGLAALIVAVTGLLGLVGTQCNKYWNEKPQEQSEHEVAFEVMQGEIDEMRTELNAIRDALEKNQQAVTEPRHVVHHFTYSDVSKMAAAHRDGTMSVTAMKAAADMAMPTMPAAATPAGEPK